MFNDGHIEQVFGTRNARFLVLVGQSNLERAHILGIGVKHESLAEDKATVYGIFLRAFHDIVFVIDLFELRIFVNIVELDGDGRRIGKIRKTTFLTIVGRHHLHVVDAVLFVIQGIVLLDRNLTGCRIDFENFRNSFSGIKQRISKLSPDVFVFSFHQANRVTHRGIFIDKEDYILKLRLFVVVEDLDDHLRLYRLFAFSIRRRSHISHNHRNRQDAVRRFVVELCAGLHLNLQSTSVICANRIKGIYCIIVGVCRLKCISKLGVIDIIDSEGTFDNFSGGTIFLDLQGIANNGRSIVYRSNIKLEPA